MLIMCPVLCACSTLTQLVSSPGCDGDGWRIRGCALMQQLIMTLASSSLSLQNTPALQHDALTKW